MRQRASGFTVLEMMIAVALFAMTAEIAVPIMRWAIIEVHNSEVDAQAATAEDRAIAALRRDIWQSRDIRVPATDHLVVVSETGQQISWQFDADGSVTRQDSLSNQRWTTGLSGLTFARDGAVVVTTVSHGPARSASMISMISPALHYEDQLK